MVSVSGAVLLECLPQDEPDAQDEQESLEKSLWVMTLWPSAWTSSSESPLKSQEPQGQDPDFDRSCRIQGSPWGNRQAARL